LKRQISEKRGKMEKRKWKGIEYYDLENWKETFFAALLMFPLGLFLLYLGFNLPYVSEILKNNTLFALGYVVLVAYSTSFITPYVLEKTGIVRVRDLTNA
jgi:hypothetical protein